MGMGSTGTIRRSRDGAGSGRNGNGVDLISGAMGGLETRGFDIGSQEINQHIPIGDIQGTFVCREPVVAYIVVLY